MAQYIEVTFDRSSRRYTYRNDGQPVAVGDRVRVKTGRTKPVAVTVAAILKPVKFETKPILGLVENAAQEEAVTKLGEDMLTELERQAKLQGGGQ